MNKKFQQLYEELLVEYSIPKVSDISIKQLQDEKQTQKKCKKVKKVIKTLNDVTRAGKCLRDLKDKIIQDRDNTVQLTAVEVEE